MATTERERKVQERALKLVRQYGGYVYKNAQNMYTEKGRPDLSACIPVKLSKLEEMYGKDATIGVFLGIELKRPGKLNEVSFAQEIVGKKITNAKGIWIAIDDTDLLEALLFKLTEDNDAIQ